MSEALASGEPLPEIDNNDLGGDADCWCGDGVDSVDDGENLPYERLWKGWGRERLL